MTRATARKTSAPIRRLELETFPGHRIRRLQQTAVAIFMQESIATDVTPVQYAVLHTLAGKPGIDQRTLAESVSFDTSTIGGVIDRLEARGLLTRSHSPGDRRVRLLHLTPEGQKAQAALELSMLSAQQRILEPLTAAERKEFMRMMNSVIEHHRQIAQIARADTPAG